MSRDRCEVDAGGSAVVVAAVRGLAELAAGSAGCSDDRCRVDAVGVVLDADSGDGVEATRWAPGMPADVPRLRWPPSLLASVVKPLSLAAALDGDPAAPEDSVDEGAAQAVPANVKIAVPTPKATASPPMRPANLDELPDMGLPFRHSDRRSTRRARQEP